MKVEKFIPFGSGFADKCIEARARGLICDDRFPAFILLAGKQKTGEISHLVTLFRWKAFTKFGDFHGAHKFYLLEMGRRCK